jgi:hypothetical protein
MIIGQAVNTNIQAAPSISEAANTAFKEILMGIASATAFPGLVETKERMTVIITGTKIRSRCP